MMSSLTEKLASTLLSQQGLAMVWNLHADAATLYRLGNVVGAAALIEIADVAEKQWQLRQKLSPE